MRVIKFKSENIIKKINNGAESTIYMYKDMNEIVALKLYDLDGKTEEEKKKILKNKEIKLQLLVNSPVLENEIKIKDLVYFNNELVGYTMNLSTLEQASCFLSKKKKIQILKELKEKIEKFNACGIYIGDFNEKNILVKKNGIVLCDLDNYRIGNFDFDLNNAFINDYKRKCKKIDNIDNYCFNYFTIGFLEKIATPCILQYIKINGLPSKLDTEENRKLIETLHNIDDNYEKKYLIDGMKKRLFK